MFFFFIYFIDNVVRRRVYKILSNFTNLLKFNLTEYYCVIEQRLFFYVNKVLLLLLCIKYV